MGFSGFLGEFLLGSTVITEYGIFGDLLFTFAALHVEASFLDMRAANRYNTWCDALFLNRFAAQF